MAILQDSQVTALLGVGADAMKNMYDIEITPPEGLKEWAGKVGGVVGAIDGDQMFNFAVRSTGFTPPTLTVNAYEIKYKTVSIKRPDTKPTFDRTFELTFRVDANWQVYRFFQAWKGMFGQASTGYASNALWGSDADGDAPGGTINNNLGTIKVAALARPIHMTSANPFAAAGVTAGSFTGGNMPTREADTAVTEDDSMSWTFNQVWCYDVSEPAFTNGDSGVLEITAKFQFGTCVEPVYALHATGSADAAVATE